MASSKKEQRRLTDCERRARQAVNRMVDNNPMVDDNVWFLNDYSTTLRGSSVSAQLASEFCDRNGISPGDSIEQYLDGETGALVIVPAGGHDVEE
jgi:hypothetical protein